MATPSLFRDFLRSLKAEWATSLPSVRPLEAALDPVMPKASTFYAGTSPSCGLHVFLHFQHSLKAYEVGQFTVNVWLSRRLGPPEPPAEPVTPSDSSAVPGRYRIGWLCGYGKDKWWHLKKDRAPKYIEAWRPSSYEDQNMVIQEAVADVSHDVKAVLSNLGISGGAKQGA